MERVAFEQLKSQVLSLTSKQRQQMQALLTPEANATGKVSDNNQLLLWDVVCDTWREILRTANPAPLAVIAERMGPLLRDASVACDAIITTHAPEMTRTQRAACYRMFVRIVLEFLAEADIPVNNRSVLQQLMNIAAHLDSSFPGSAAANLLGIVLRRLVGAS